MNTNGKIFIAFLLTVSLIACQGESAPDAGDSGTPNASTYAVSGTITGKFLGGVTVSLSGNSLPSALTTTSQADGKYSFADIKPGLYKVQPSKTGFSFTPTFRDIEVKSAALTVPAFASNEPAPVFACTDTTNAWCRPSPAVSTPINRIWASNGLDVWFVGNGGAVLRYTNISDLESWKKLNAGTTTDLYAIWGSSPNDVWVGGAGGRNVYHYVKGASPEWTTVPATTTTQDINMLWGTNSSDVVRYAGCAQSVGNFAPDGGAWKDTSIPQWTHVYSAWGAGSGIQWAVGGERFGFGRSGPLGGDRPNGMIFQMLSDGSWKNANSTGLKLFSPALEAAVNNGARFSDIRGTGENDIWSVGIKGLVAHYNGTQWDLVDAGVGTTNLYGVWPVSANEVWFAGGDPAANTGKLVKYTGAGTSWTSQTITTLPSDAGVIYRVYVDSASNSVWLGGASGILRYKP